MEEKRITLLEERVEIHEKRITAHGKQIDDLIDRDGQKDLDLALMKKDIENTNESVKRMEKTVGKIDEKLDKLMDTRHGDHLVTPLENYRKIVWLFIGIAVTFIGKVLIEVLFRGV